ncbi:uncharacterized protein [Macrobrachium rosenbergii]|uniref:uncharacterized protein n=1 Tax=Macrobrachium rosenbergii TaxID=79674 RepID=UPI0034D73E31
MSHCNSSSWYSQLPWVLLSLQTTSKEGLDLSAAKVVYGDLLVIPGEFLHDSNPSPDIIKLWTIVRKSASDHPSYKSTNNTFIPKDLHTATHRTNAVQPPLTQPYAGPYRVIHSKQKAFLTDIRSTTDWVAIDRLKPERHYPSNPVSKGSTPSATPWSTLRLPVPLPPYCRTGSKWYDLFAKGSANVWGSVMMYPSAEEHLLNGCVRFEEGDAC